MKFIIIAFNSLANLILLNILFLAGIRPNLCFAKKKADLHLINILLFYIFFHKQNNPTNESQRDIKVR